MKVMNLRHFRHRHHISLVQLSQAAGISHQHLSRIELLTERPSQGARVAIVCGLEQIIRAQKAQSVALETEYLALGSRLFDTVLASPEEVQL